MAGYHGSAEGRKDPFENNKAEAAIIVYAD